mmetsp:Transcript_39330/g.75360  ORF Transcript_39330/g.75360 Transcript_39330/m.75360 type:complete len:336 (-) Transcript_39330:575-1582(-)
MAGLPISAFQDVDEFKYVKDLGSGNFGIARLCVNESTGEKVAIKYIQRGPKIDSNVAREIVNHRGLRHPNIVQFRRIALTDTHLAIVMEYASGGELFDRICDAGRFSEAEARFFFQQLISGVAYCHRKGIAHRDLKLENTLLDGSETPRLKICDFGYSKSSLLHSMPKSTVGTPAYIAPEVLVSKKYDGKIADVWSCGVTLFVMLVGGYPFEDPDDPRDYRKTIKRIVAVDYTIPGECTISPQCKDLMARIFVADPHQRISIHDIWDHPWFVENLPRDLVSPDDDVEMESEQQSIKDIEAILEQAKITGDTSLEQDFVDDDDDEDFSGDDQYWEQ